MKARVEAVLQGRWVALLVGVLSGGFLAARLFVGGAIGLSDQGDGTRLLCSLGVREGNPFNASETDHVYLTWYPHHWYGEACGAIGSGEPYNSSQLWILHVAKWLTPILGLPGGIDLRALGVVFCVLVGLAVGGLYLLLPGSVWGRLLGVAVAMLVVADGAFAGYFVSPYSEPAALVGILALILAVLVFVRTQTGRWWAAALVGAACLFTITAKTQSLSFLVVVVPLILWRTTFGASVKARAAAGGERGRVRHLYRLLYFAVSRWPALLVAVVLTSVSVVYLQAQPKTFDVQTRYAEVFIEMLPHSRNPAQDLRRLGLDPALVSSSGKAITDPGSAAYLPSFTDFPDKASPVRTTLVYLRQPDRLLSMMDRGMAGMAIWRPDYLGSYPPSAHLPPRSKECRICAVQWVWKGLFGPAPWLIFVLTLIAMGCCLRLALTRRDDRRLVAVGVLGLVLAWSSIAQFWVVMLTVGAADLVKHMVLSDFLTALLFLVGGYSVYLLRTTEPVESVESVEDAEPATRRPVVAGARTTTNGRPAAPATGDPAVDGAAARARQSLAAFEEMLDRRSEARTAEPPASEEPGDRTAE